MIKLQIEKRKSSADFAEQRLSRAVLCHCCLVSPWSGDTSLCWLFWVRNSSQIQRCCSSLGLPPPTKYVGLEQAEVTLQQPLRGSAKLLRAAVFYHGASLESQGSWTEA